MRRSRRYGSEGPGLQEIQADTRQEVDAGVSSREEHAASAEVAEAPAHVPVQGGEGELAPKELTVATAAIVGGGSLSVFNPLGRFIDSVHEVFPGAGAMYLPTQVQHSSGVTAGSWVRVAVTETANPVTGKPKHSTGANGG